MSQGTRTTDRIFRAAALVLAVLPATAWAQSSDRVRLTEKIDGAVEISGEIVALSPGDVEIRSESSGEVKKVPIEKIREVMIGGEPDALRNARNLLSREQPAAALEELEKIDKAELDAASDNLLAEEAFVRAAATGRQATVTGADLPTAEKALREFLQKHPRSHHVFRSSELLGDLLVKAGKYEEATSAYAALEKGPPAFRVRAATAKAGSYFEQKKYAEAEREYEAAVKTQTDPKDEASARQKREAEAGRARCLARQGKNAEAIGILQGVIRAADPEDRDLLARAYTALGEAFQASAKEQDALIAFLTVDLVYNTVPEVHAEALYNLVQLWLKAQNPERSRTARQSLETSYPASRWTKALAEAAGKG